MAQGRSDRYTAGMAMAVLVVTSVPTAPTVLTVYLIPPAMNVIGSSILVDYVDIAKQRMYSQHIGIFHTWILILHVVTLLLSNSDIVA